MDAPGAVVTEASEAMATAVVSTTMDAYFRRYSPYVAAIANRLLGRDDEIDDVVQDVFMDALRGISQLREPEAVRGWLATVTVRVARRRLKIRRLKGWFGLDAAPDYEQFADPDASPEHRTLMKQLYRALDALDTDLRVAWTLRHVEGMQLEAVAEHCECSLATVKRRIVAAELALKEAVRHA